MREFYIGLSLLLRLCPVLNNISSSTNFHKSYKYFSLPLLALTTQLIPKLYKYLVFLVLPSHYYSKHIRRFVVGLFLLLFKDFCIYR